MDLWNNNSRTRTPPQYEAANYNGSLDLSLTIGRPQSPPSPPPFPDFNLLPPLAADFPYRPLLAAQLHHLPAPPSPPPPPPPHDLLILPPQPPQRDRRGLQRRGAFGGRNMNTGPIPPPYPWATDRRANIHSLVYLRTNGITQISGRVRCKQCDRQFDIQYDLFEKFGRLRDYIVSNVLEMHNRAPKRWKNPIFPTCDQCGQANSLRPILAKKKDINWLFLLLGESIGYCTIKELKYFCKHTSNHRTAAKDRLIYIAYMMLCRQLDPTGPYYITDQ